MTSFAGRHRLAAILVVLALLVSGATVLGRAFFGIPQISATLDDSLVVDQDGDNRADPGDVLGYQAEVDGSERRWSGDPPSRRT